MPDPFASLQGSLLLATPALRDPNFARTVVLVTEHTRSAAMGIVLNRPLPVTASEAVPLLGGLVEHDDPVFQGGPVQPEAVVALARFADPAVAAAIAFGSVGFLRADADPGDVDAAVERVRVYSGYAGWGPGQLDGEVEEDAWIVEPALPDDVFGPADRDLWSTVLRRKGREYALLSTMPPDPTLN